MLNVDIVMRSDYGAKFGGDVLQVQKYIEHLPRDVVSARVVAFASGMELRAGAIVHIVNVDRPWDFLEAANRANDRPVVVSTIHHDVYRYRRIAAQRGRSLRRVVDALVPEPALTVGKRVYRDRSWPAVGGMMGLRPWVSAKALRRQVGRTLERADAVLLLACAERRVVERDFQCQLPNAVVIPNGIPTTLAANRQRDIPILVPGRIEPRKNQVALAVALGHLGVQATFLGPANPNDMRYAQAFARLVERAPNLVWVPGVSPSEMTSWYQRAKIVLNLSMVEVLSLVDLEAYGAGCQLVTTRYGHTLEWLGDAAMYVDPDNAVSAVANAQAFLDGWTPNVPDPDILARMNWPRIAKQLTDVYLSVAARGNPVKGVGRSSRGNNDDLARV